MASRLPARLTLPSKRAFRGNDGKDAAQIERSAAVGLPFGSFVALLNPYDTLIVIPERSDRAVCPSFLRAR
jgi:hypothetical protein